MKYILNLFFIIILIYILVNRKQKIILFKYNKNDDFNYICNTFIDIHKPDDINKFIKNIQLKIDNLNILNNENGLFITVNTDKELNSVLYSKLKSTILWK